MTAVNRPLYIECGATFSFGFNWCRELEPTTDPPTAGEPYDLTGCVAHMQIRAKPTSTDVLIDATTENQIILLGSLDGRIDIVIPGSFTEPLIAKSGVYDFEITMADPLPNGEPDIRRLMKGPVTFDPNVTKEVIA